ncbi:uncharacterized protein LOC131962795 [Centropristis striata]|uniref:uncharacterized protein LOC131962795 n=1 Tax=Centropristis striata TaxID=184440 RepID=UPI0027DFA11A|nr:uncharacterized protein LOC131962795 [Centropristis striata]XP_059183862.1 uncharacterized protein LOC131962795 [Centropristis striata]
MAEEGSVYELEGLQQQLDSLLSRFSGDQLLDDSEPFCSDFCKLVEEFASRWQVPLPQLRILEIALCYFARACSFFPTNCDHVLHTLSSLALSVFELLLFFDQTDFLQEPLKHFADTFQECHHLALAKHQNVHLLQVERLVKGGGPWAGQALQAILSESSLPQSEVDGCISSELPVFFELRVRYLLSCERVSEALALAKCCAQHSTAGQHLFFLQVYLTWLIKTSQHDRLHKEVAEFNGKDAIHIICSLECEEKDELLLDLSRAFLSQQLRRGDMYYICDLVLFWSKLHSRLNTSKKALLEDCHQLMLSATNVNSIFPFIRAILQELGEDGIQFCVELCANALRSCLPCDVITKSLIYKTIAGLLPNDLEVARACALLLFFLEHTVETYKMVYLLYMHPDQEYHAEHSPIGNHVRFETLQVLKKDLYFDPEFWNLIALRTNCLKLMSEKGLSAALEEVMEDKWILSYCTKEPSSRTRTSVCQKGTKGAKRRQHKDDIDTASKRLKFGPGKTRLNADHTVKKKGNQGLRSLKDEPLRRSFWQIDRLRDNVAAGYGELRRTTRLSEKNPPKRRIMKPKWLLEDSGTLLDNNVLPKIKKHGLKHQKHHRSSVEKRSETGGLNNNAKHTPPIIPHLRAREINSNSPKPSPSPQVILELSLPDNELMGTFSEDSCNRQRGFPQVLLYRPTVKVPAKSPPVKTVHRKEVILRARDAAMLVQQLHCYIRRQKGKGNGPNVQGSVSTITRSSVQGSPPKDPQSKRCERTAARLKRRITSQTPAADEIKKFTASEKVPQTTKAVSRKASLGRELSEKSAAKVKVDNGSQTSATANVTEAPMLDKVLQRPPIASAKELCEESAVEMKVTIASTAAKVTQSQALEEVTKVGKDASKTTASSEVLQTATVDNNYVVVTDSSVSNKANISNTGAAKLTPSQSQDVVRERNRGKNPVAHAKTDSPEVLIAVCNNLSEVEVSPKLSKGQMPCENDSDRETMAPSCSPTDQNSLTDISALTLVTEVVTELAPGVLTRDLENHKQLAPEDSSSKESTAGSKSKVPRKVCTTSSRSVVVDEQMEEEGTQKFDPEAPENSKLPEPEEAKLEYCCTFCNKDFKGTRVVAHAMFHYRKDECMFCGTMFKDDLLAMMHLSDHIEKLKRSKDLAENNAQENLITGTKDISTPKTSAKIKTTDESSGRRGRGRPRKSTDCLKSISLPDAAPSGSRNLRSSDKPEDGESLHEKKQNTSKHLNCKAPVHKVNGHIGKQKELKRLRKNRLNLEAKRPHTQREVSHKTTTHAVENPRLQANQDIEMCSSATSTKVDKVFSCSSEHKVKEKESPHVLKTATKQTGKVVEKTLEPEEKLCCPVQGCDWFTDLAKKRVALLYHALEEHNGDVKPLKLAFNVGNSRCSCCMRVMWSFEHFQHHIERHRLTPRHPCLHLGCTARFKSGMEMRRHARRHSPLQAVCCLPGCSKLFICLWALNLHEREHYASNHTKPDKNTNEQTDDRMLDGKKQPLKTKDATTVNKTDCKLKSPPPTTVRASLLKEELTERHETEEERILKNLSNKDTSTQPTGPNLRLRQTIRKVTNTTMKNHKVISSSLPKHNIKVRHKFKKKQIIIVNKMGPKRRGRPPKSKQTVHDENTTNGQNSKTVKDETIRLANPSKAANVNESKEERIQQVQDVARTKETSSDESKSKKSINRQMKKNNVKHKRITRNASTVGPKTQKLTADKIKKLQRGTKCSAPEEDGSQTASSDSSKTKKLKVANGKKTTKIVKKKIPLKEQECASQSGSDVPRVEAKAAAAAAVVESAADEKGNAKAETTGETQSCSGNSVPATLANIVNEITATPTTSQEKTQQVTTVEKSKKSNVKKEGKTEKTTSSKDSGKTNKKHKVISNKGDKKTPKGPLCKDASQTTALKKKAKSKSADQQLEAKAAAAESSPDCEGKAKEETTLDSSGSSVPTKEKPKKSNVTKNSDPNKANKKRKIVPKEGEAKIIKKRCKNEEKKKPAKMKTNVQLPPEVKAELVNSSSAQEGKTPGETPQSGANSSGYSVITNGQASKEDVSSTLLKQTLEEYSKKPYMRPPPTAYLDEKYITMPKRRKELSFLQTSQRSPPQQVQVPAALQRQRCANCFATFNSGEELQSHLQLKKCSNIFGFDSDDEGEAFFL